MAGTYDDNPFLNTIIYEVEFPDGQVKDNAANVIAENMLTQVDSDGFALTMMDGIIDYERDNAVAIPKSDAYIVTRRGRKSCTSYVDGARRMTCTVPSRMLRFQIPPEVKLVSRLMNVSLLKLKIFEDRASPPPQAPAQHDPPKSA